jgi:hypothetical protein
MAGVMQAALKMSVSGVAPSATFPSVTSTLGVDQWTGPAVVQVADTVNNQAIISIGGQGIPTVQGGAITSDRNITVRYNGALALLLSANGLHSFFGTTITAIDFSNNSGAVANITYLLGGV